MNLLSSFMVISFNGADRVSITYDVVDAGSGDIVSSNNKESFIVTTSEMRTAIEAIRSYICEHKLAD